MLISEESKKAVVKNDNILNDLIMLSSLNW